MIITNMNHQVEEDNKNMVLLSQFYPPDVLTTAGMFPQQGEASDIKPKRRNRKRKNGDDGGLTGLKKRKLTAEQAELLEMHFGNEHKLETDRKDKLALELGLHPRQVAVWFQNRRARDKTKKIEESYASLKTTHENVLVEKGRLESEVAMLKEKLSGVEKEMKRLTELFDAISVNSNPNPTLTMEMETVDSPLACVDSPFACVDSPLACVDSPFACVDSPFACVDSPFAGWFNYEELCYLLEQNYISAVEWHLSQRNY